MAFLYLFGYWVEGAQFHVVEILNSIGIKSPKSCTDICYVHWGWTPMLVVLSIDINRLGCRMPCSAIHNVIGLRLNWVKAHTKKSFEHRSWRWPRPWRGRRFGSPELTLFLIYLDLLTSPLMIGSNIKRVALKNFLGYIALSSLQLLSHFQFLH